MCLGEVGAIFGLEVSRLARSSADLSRLLELARLTDTLVIDADGIYDLADFNDRLLLGLEEPDVRGRAAFPGRPPARRQAGRGRTWRAALPAAGRLRLRRRRRTSSSTLTTRSKPRSPTCSPRSGPAGPPFEVVGAFKDRRFPASLRRGVGRSVALGSAHPFPGAGILANPAYAGAYVFGRDHRRRIVEPDGTVRTKVDPPAPGEMAGGHPRPSSTATSAGTTTCANQARLAANLTHAGARPAPGRTRPVPGHHLLRVLRSSHVDPLPPQRRADYECAPRGRPDRTHRPAGRSRADTVDDAVAERLLDALNPEEVALALAAADEVADRRRRAHPAPSWPSSGPATKPTAPSEPSTPANRRTAWSPAAWRPAGRHETGHPRRGRKGASRYPRSHRRRCPSGPTWKPSPPTCPHCGTRPPPPPGTANGCCAPSSPTSRSFPSRTWPMPASGSAGTPAPPTRSSSPARRTSPNGPHRPRRRRPRRPAQPHHQQLAEPQRRRPRHRRRTALRPQAVTNLRHYHHIAHPHCSVTARPPSPTSLAGSASATAPLSTGSTEGGSPPVEASTTNGASPSAQKQWTPAATCTRSAHAPARHPSHGRPERTVAEVARHLQVSADAVYYWIANGSIPARRAGGRLRIAVHAHIEQACQDRIASSVHLPYARPQDHDQ